MRLARLLPMLLAAACIATAGPLYAQGAAPTPDDDFRVYAVNVVKTRLFEKEFTGYGIYLGRGKVITAAHVVGRWPTLTHLRVRVGGLELPAEMVKTHEATDLALLAVDETQLPVSLRLRRNPLCKEQPPFGARVVVVYPERAVETRTISPVFIPPKYRARMSSLIEEQQGSGAGVFFPAATACSASSA